MACSVSYGIRITQQFETVQELVRARTEKPLRFPGLLTVLHGDDAAQAPAGSLVNNF